ncbi:MAG: hypothetical protein WCY36_00295 [Candidatus Omnitrophota bacterium]
MNYPRGSEWRKWDLHLHTPSSYDYDDKSVTDEQLIKTLKENEITVVAITDHHFIDVEKIKKLQELAKDEITIFPGIELRAELGGSESIHFIGIFPEDSDVNDIWTKLQGQLELTPADVKKKGNDKIYCHLNKAAELIHQLGGIITIHAGSKSNSVEKITNALPYKEALKEDIVKSINVYEIGNSADVEGYRSNVFPNIGIKIPLVICSDNHDIKKYVLKENCWIKADPTFTGLKQIILEPEDRVYIGKAPTRRKNLASVIDKIEISNSNGWFEESPIVLNEDLVTIIGEKGAGKTALADFIALAGGDFGLQKSDASSFVFKALTPTKQIEKTIENCQVTIKWKEGNPDQITINKELVDYKPTKKVKYLSQSFIEEKCRPEHADELRKEIENIVFQYIPTSDRLGQTTFNDLKRLMTRGIEVEKSNCRQLLFDLNGEISILRDEIDNLEVQKSTKKKTEDEITQLNEQKPKPADAEEKAIEDKLAILYTKKSEINEKVAECKLQLSTIESIKTKLLALSQYVEKELISIKTDLDSIALGSIYNKLTFSINPEFHTKLDEAKNKLTKQIKDFEGAPEKVSSLTEDEKKLELITTDFVNGLTLSRLDVIIEWLETKSSIAYDARKVIKDFEEKIEKNKKAVASLEKSIAEVEKTKKPTLAKKIEERNSAYKSYFTLLQKEKSVFESLSAPIKTKIDSENVGDKQIGYSARIEFDVNGFYEKACEIINFKAAGHYHQDGQLLFKDIKAIAEKIELAEDADVCACLVDRFIQTFEKDDGSDVDIKTQLKKGKKQIDFDAWLFGISFFSVTYSIKYQDTYIELLSPGKKGIVLLLMYLTLDAESGIPLIIDQPEENLDNKSVYAHLIEYFRQAKKRRQIIVVTHNPNLVLNTDAEQVLVADFQVVPPAGQARIRYISGSIENSFINESLKDPLRRQGIREHGAEILEGGKKAFIQRKDKYEY